MATRERVSAECFAVSYGLLCRDPAAVAAALETEANSTFYNIEQHTWETFLEYCLREEDWRMACLFLRAGADGSRLPLQSSEVLQAFVDLVQLCSIPTEEPFDWDEVQEALELLGFAGSDDWKEQLRVARRDCSHWERSLRLQLEQRITTMTIWTYLTEAVPRQLLQECDTDAT